jgi:hypothetical protein
MIPSSHNAALWAHTHNRIHHRYTNLRGLDFVWQPMSPDEYQQASPFQRWLYRLYRARLGAIPYNIVVMGGSTISCRSIRRCGRRCANACSTRSSSWSAGLATRCSSAR